MAGSKRIATPEYKRAIGKEIDLVLAVLRARWPERAMSYTEMADIIGCHHNTLFLIGNRAMRKFRARMMAMVDPDELDDIVKALRR